jgi:hypothetical protein
MSSTAPEVEPFLITDTPYKRPGRISHFIKKLKTNQPCIFLSVLMLLFLFIAIVIGLVLIDFPTSGEPALPGLAIAPRSSSLSPR